MAGVTGDTESGDGAVGLLDAVAIEVGLILGGPCRVIGIGSTRRRKRLRTGVLTAASDRISNT